MSSELDPFALLESDSALDRQRGARALVGILARDEVERVREIRAREVDSFVQHALDQAIRSVDQPATRFGDSDGWMQLASGQLTDDIRAEAIQYVTKVMLHELRPLVGEVLRATRDFMGADFDGSESAASIERLRDFLQIMHRLHEAASPPTIIQFDLVDLLNEEVVAAQDGGIEIALTRSDSLVVEGDSSLLRLAFQNCLRNAIEASYSSRRTILVTCGTNQSETWVSILDEGDGLREGGDKLLEPGNSTKSKDDHFGMGLPIAQRAMKSFGGSVELLPRDPVGTSCALKWPRQADLS